MPKIAIFDGDVRRHRRQLVRSRALLSPKLFCQQRGISRVRLLQLERRGELFSVIVGRKPYFPAVLADGSLDQRRLEKLLKRLSSDIPPIAKYLFLVGRRGSLGDKTVLHAMRSGKRYRIALRLADNIGSDYG
jgi:hypothetical protein